MSAASRFARSSALVVVDVQNDFADPAGALFVMGGDVVARRVAKLMASASRKGALVVCTQDWHPFATPHFRDQGGPWPRHCVADSWGAAIHPLLPAPHEVVRKGKGREDGYSGFGVRDLSTGATYPTELPRLLSGRDIREVILVGLALDVCIKATALDAVAGGLRVTLVCDATAPVELAPGDGAAAIAEMAAAGVDLS